ncbi:GNAT family N-acetyltransferase [Candidatus Avoscillospira sp. LCP25S3_F1]|uniref:GNAT family N-acetyltransferase n=1 Tax=Candidatus Avoscillospira sp. LCP25S3_F1 TaxID=3438825 RepID=UPI003F91D8DB
MKDIPIFTGEHGVATLILREIPHQQRAYVMLRTVWRLQPFLAECRAFCRMAGAESVYVTGQEALHSLPFVHAMERWTCRRAALPPLLEPVDLTPLDDGNREEFRTLYNRLFAQVPNAATCTSQEAARIQQEEQAALAVVHGQTAGLAQWTDGCLEAIGVEPEFRGLGYRLALTVLHRMTTETVELQVSSANQRAVALYQRLGFTKAETLSRWYDLTEE